MNFTELLITMALTGLILFGIESTLLFAQHQNTQNQRVQLNEQVQINNDQELFLK